MGSIMAVLKSRTFWGGLLFAVVRCLEGRGLVPSDVGTVIESAAVGLGLYGARNVADPSLVGPVSVGEKAPE